MEQTNINQNKKPSPQNNDSTTNVYLRSDVHRKILSVRIKPELRKAIKQFCRQNGLSICHISEALYTAYLVGVGQQIEFVNKSPTINLTLVRDVKRVRRYAKESDVNKYDPQTGYWIFERDAELNEHGHALGCGCKICCGGAGHVSQ